MRPMGRLIVRALLLSLAGMVTVAAASASAATCTGVRPQTGSVFIPVGDDTRAFTVRLPAGYDGRTPAPVVFALHPGGMNMGYMQAEVPLPREWPEAVAIYGQALPRDAGGRPSWQNKPGDFGDRDLKYFDAMMAWLGQHVCYDDKRVFVWGYSNGAGLANLIACYKADVIAGAVIAAGRMDCKPSAAKPIILSHGTSDLSIPYARAMEAAAVWTALNGCSAPPKDKVPGCFAAEGCKTAPLTLCTYDGGHGYHTPFNKTAVEFLKALEQ